jgi:hypothetical protein
VGQVLVYDIYLEYWLFMSRPLYFFVQESSVGPGGAAAIVGLVLRVRDSLIDSCRRESSEAPRSYHVVAEEVEQREDEGRFS